MLEMSKNCQRKCIAQSRTKAVGPAGAMFVLDSKPFAKKPRANPFPFVSHKHANFYSNLSCMATLSKLHAGIGLCQFVVQVMLSEFRSSCNDQA